MTEKNLNIDIEHIAQLARIELSEEEKPRYQAQLVSLLNHFDVIDGVCMDDLEDPLPLYNVWQADQIEQPLSVEAALSNAPDERNDQIKVLNIVN
jgi:aspartyl-tRNA(Asn)/glutamyl-tRNA(Gln) amidotransferase subunit C